MPGLNAFYDPVLYELNVGYAPRLTDTYLTMTKHVDPSHTVMELGCGIGDVILPFAERGHPVVGVDRSPEMLDHFSRRLAGSPVADRVRLLRADLPALDLDEPVDVVLLPNDLASHLLTTDDLTATLRAVHDALRPGGEVLLDISRFDVTDLAGKSGGSGQLVRVHGFFDYPGGRTLRVSEQTTYDQRSGVLTAAFCYELLDADAVVEKTWYRLLRLHPRTIEEMTSSLRAAGFDIRAVRDDVCPPGIDNILVHGVRNDARA